eukprot:UN00285
MNERFQDGLPIILQDQMEEETWLDLVMDFEHIIQRRLPIARSCAILLIFNTLLFLEGLLYKVYNMLNALILYVLILFCLFYWERKVNR